MLLIEASTTCAPRLQKFAGVADASMPRIDALASICYSRRANAEE